MSLSIGIVGLPNVGKSTLFNTLTKTKSAEASNYPFCTIDPNIGIVKVPDERLRKIAEIINPQKIVPAIVEFVDIAGLVKGASTGEGLGNKFLANIRETNAIVHIIRLFEDNNIHHVKGKINPKDDIEVINTELILADLQTVEKRYGDMQKKARGQDKEAIKFLMAIEKVKTVLEAGDLAKTAELNEDELALIKSLHLITMKPVIYVANISEDMIGSEKLVNYKKELNIPDLIPICAKIEEDIAQMSEEEAQIFLTEYNLTESGLNKLIQTGFKTLNLHTYFTAGEMEVKAWTVRIGAKAPEAAGVIHTDFEKGFIKAEVADWEKFVNCKGWNGLKEKGLMRLEGKEYIVQDGDVMYFMFNN